MTKDEALSAKHEGATTVALKLALEALETCNWVDDGGYGHAEYDHVSTNKAITAIREALAQPDVARRSTESKETFDQQEPVAYLDEGLGAFYWAKDYKKHVGFKPLYTTPPQRKPLTDEEIGRIAGETLDAWSCARAIEAAHGIKE